MSSTNEITEVCDKCSRLLDGKGYLDIDGWKICGICQWEKEIELKIKKGVKIR